MNIFSSLNLNFLKTGWSSFQKNFVTQRVATLLLLWGGGVTLGLVLLREGGTADTLLCLYLVTAAFLCAGFHLGISLRHRDKKKEQGLLSLFLEIISPFLAMNGGLSIAKIIFVEILFEAFKIKTGPNIFLDMNSAVLGLFASLLWLCLGWTHMEIAEKKRYEPLVRKLGFGLN